VVFPALYYKYIEICAALSINASVIVAQVVSTCGVLSSNPILNIYNKLLKTIFLFITGKKKKKKKKLKHVPPLSTSIRESARAERASKKNWLEAPS
jgi:hypothetical protein